MGESETLPALVDVEPPEVRYDCMTLAQRRVFNQRRTTMAKRRDFNAQHLLTKIDQVEDYLAEKHNVIDKDETYALRLLVDIQFRKLSKLLPDLKATELSTRGGGSIKVVIEGA